MSEQESVLDGRDIGLQHVSSVVIGALIVAAVAAWVTTAVANPLLIFVVVALATGYLLHTREGEREKFAFVGYAVVGLLALSPVFFFLPDVFSGRSVTLSQLMTVVIGRLLLLVAGIVGYIVYRLNGGTGVLARARDPDKRLSLAGYAVAALLVVLPAVLFIIEFIAGGDVLTSLSALLWRLIGLAGVGLGYAAYRADGGQGIVERIQAVTAD